MDTSGHPGIGVRPVRGPRAPVVSSRSPGHRVDAGGAYISGDGAETEPDDSREPGGDDEPEQERLKHR